MLSEQHGTTYQKRKYNGWRKCVNAAFAKIICLYSTSSPKGLLESEEIFEENTARSNLSARAVWPPVCRVNSCNMLLGRNENIKFIEKKSTHLMQITAKRTAANTKKYTHLSGICKDITRPYSEPDSTQTQFCLYICSNIRT